MKPSSHLTKTGPSVNSKSKKSSKDREKRKSQGNISEINSTEKGSPTKDSNSRLYAGIDSDSLTIYAEQIGIEHLADEITNTLTEDINYRLRYIINDSLIKARLSGRNAISCQDIEQTFDNLKTDKVYGTPSHPNWVQFGYQNLYYLDDKSLNLVELAFEENTFYQHSETLIKKKWTPEQSTLLKKYFTTVCQMIVSNDVEVRKTALKNIAHNPRIGTIIEWFYNFAYILLSKDITYDCLTLRALDLITVLENSQMCRVNVSEKLLKLLVRLILQRLLKSAPTEEILKKICRVLTVLCERIPLKNFVVLKVLQKMGEVFYNHDLAVIMVINCLGVDAVKDILLPNLALFLNRVTERKESPYTYSVLQSYYILFKEDLITLPIYNAFFDYFGENLLAFTLVTENLTSGSKDSILFSKDINFAHVKCNLMKRRRKINPIGKSTVMTIDQVFEMPSEDSMLRKKLDSVERNNFVKQTSVVIGRTSLLLPIFEKKKSCLRCCNHMLWYQF